MISASPLERYGGTMFGVLRPARSIDESETVEFGKVQLRRQGAEVARRIHELTREVIGFHHDAKPLIGTLEPLLAAVSWSCISS